MQVPNRVKSVRTERGMPLSVLARRAGVARQTLYTIEEGGASATVGVMRRVADVLGVSLSDIFDVPSEDESIAEAAVA